MGLIAVFVPGGQEAVDQVLRECTAQNGGKLVGNPTIQKDLMGITLQDQEEDVVVTLVVIEEEADRAGWWREFSRIHGWKLPTRKTPNEDTVTDP